MPLIDRIRTDSIIARKEKKPEATLLVTLLAEAQMVGKNNGNRPSTDEEVAKLVTKFVKSTNETKDALDKAGRDSSKAAFELSVLAGYLPRMMTEDEMRAAVDLGKIAVGYASPADKGRLMGHLKATHGAAINLKFVSGII